MMHLEAEKYLDRIKKIDAMIINKQRDYDRWVEVADGIGGASIGERVQTSRNLHRGADAIGNYIDIETEIRALKQERQAIIKTIEALPSTEYDLIYKLYVQDYTMKELAYHFGKSYDWVKFKKRRAFMLVQSLLDAQTSTESG
jgi:DNA-directed RNA polymerase specialized sigma24 family protein